MPISRWSVKFRVPEAVIGGLPKDRGTLSLREPPAARSPVVVLGLTGRPLVFFRSERRWRVLVFSGQGFGLAGSFCHCRQAL